MYWNRLIANNETSLQRISSKDIRRNILNETAQVPTPQPVIMAQLSPLPRIDNPELYTIHDEPIPLQIRRMYIRYQIRNTHTYIMEYSATLEMIDESLATDDRLHRQHGMMEFRNPYRFPGPTEMENSMPPTWIQWISRKANKLCNELTQVIDQETNETLLEFRLIPEDVEPEGETQPDLMGFETPWPGNEVGVGGGRGQQPSTGVTRAPK